MIKVEKNENLLESVFDFGETLELPEELTVLEAVINLRFMYLIEATSPSYDEDKAREYGLENWEHLFEINRRNWDWVFGKETRVKKFARTPRHIERKIAIAEDRHAGYEGPHAGTI